MRLLRSVPLALAAVFATACIDDPTAVEEEGAPPLSQEEVEFLGLTHLFTALEAQESVEDSTDLALGAGRVERLTPAARPALAPVTFDNAISTVVPCELGGEMQVDASLGGFVDDETGAADLVFNFVMTPDRCRESDDGFSPTLFGDPNVTVNLEILTEGDGVIDIEGFIRGGIGALIGGRIAECAMDLTFSGSESAEGETTLTVQGEVCGRPVSTTTGAGEST